MNKKDGTTLWLNAAQAILFETSYQRLKKEGESKGSFIIRLKNYYEEQEEKK